MNAQLSERVLNELCALVGFEHAGALSKGAKLQIDNNVVTFVYDENLSPQKLAVYVDMGKAQSTQTRALEVLMKLNFSLGVGARGVLSLHPVTDHVFYAFHYPLDTKASGQAMLDTLIRCVGDIGIDVQAMRELVPQE